MLLSIWFIDFSTEVSYLNQLSKLHTLSDHLLLAGVAVGTEFCGAESAAVHDPTILTLTIIGMLQHEAISTFTCIQISLYTQLALSNELEQVCNGSRWENNFFYSIHNFATRMSFGTSISA